MNGDLLHSQKGAMDAFRFLLLPLFRCITNGALARGAYLSFGSG